MSQPEAPGELRCGACGGTEYLRPFSFWHSTPICWPCFMIWYDPDEPIDVTKPEAVGRLSLKLKAEGKWPWSTEALKRLDSKR